MPLISQVGRKSPKAMMVIILFYLILSIGAISIVYPFTMMLSLSVTNRMDYTLFKLIPLVFEGHAGRFAYFIGDRYGNSDWTYFTAAYDDIKSGYWSDIALEPKGFMERMNFRKPDDSRMLKYQDFVASLPLDEVGFLHYGQVNFKYGKDVLKPLKKTLSSDDYEKLPQWIGLEPFEQYSWHPPEADNLAYGKVLEYRSKWPVSDRKVITGKYLWLRWLREKMPLGEANSILGTSFKSELDIPFLVEPLRERFFKEGVPLRMQGTIPEEKYAKFIGSKDRYVELPIAEYDYWLFSRNETKWFWYGLTDNYYRIYVFMTDKANAAFNTLILVILCVGTALIINPIAAYALSRFRMKSAPMIILFCLATSVFPAEVSMIPNFLLLRDLGFLNTFAALVLPGAANGFAIFMLKGFFDALPKELYEAADLDGAGEFVKFWHITMRLSAPIIAVTALGSFTAAFTGFMWAFLVCQDMNLWTIMVWVFQYQSLATPSGAIAALVVASIPTLLVFLFCQKIILRGIILPSLK